MCKAEGWRSREDHLLPSRTSLWTSARGRQSCPLDPQPQVNLRTCWTFSIDRMAPYSSPDAGPPPNYTPPPPPLSDEEEEEDLGRREPATSTPIANLQRPSPPPPNPSRPQPPPPNSSRPQPPPPTVVHTWLF